MNNLKTSRVCMAGSLYSFTFYLLISSYEEILATTYFFDKNIPATIREKLPNKYFLDKKSWYRRNNYLQSIYTLMVRRFKYPELINSEIFGLDFEWALLRGLNMNYIEDCPHVLDIWETSHLYEAYKEFGTYSRLKKNLKRILFGEYYQHPVGTSSKVKTIYASNPYDKEYHLGKDKCFISLEKEWNNCSKVKKDLILSIFNIEEKDIHILHSRKVILLTQAFVADKKMTESEAIEVYKKIISHYGEKNVIIKPHPRDKCDYKAACPNTLLFEKIIPMQLLTILGITFERIATINSSSALSFGLNANIDWWGEGMDHSILKDEGFFTLEEAKKSLCK